MISREHIDIMAYDIAKIIMEREATRDMDPARLANIMANAYETAKAALNMKMEKEAESFDVSEIMKSASDEDLATRFK